MKSTKNILIGVLLLALAACAGPANPPDATVKVSLKNYYYENNAGEIIVPSEVRLIGSFNNWGNGGTDFSSIWNNADVMKLNNNIGEFEATIAWYKGKEIKFTFVVKEVNPRTGQSAGQGWINPATFKNSKDEYLFSPFTRFEDNGMGNGGSNAVYLVP